MSAEKTGELWEKISPFRKQLCEHKLYKSIQSVEDLKIFMEGHIFAVWDFMSLLKALQRRLTCVEIPWMPTPNPAARRLINEIVLSEESDLNPEGIASSHFELYLEAMDDIGADYSPIITIMQAINRGKSMDEALAESQVNKTITDFLRFTFDTIQNGHLHEIAAVFTFGREDLIPDMFTEIVRELNRESGELDNMIYYLERHIEVDKDEHGPMAMRMIDEICKEDPVKWKEAETASTEAMKQRLDLWDYLVKKMEDRQQTVS